MLATVVPAAVEASAAVTSVHASTFEISLASGLGDGEWPSDEDEDEAEGELDDPHAAMKRPAAATTANTPIWRTMAWPVRLNLGFVAPIGYSGRTARSNGIAVRR
jgi:hypothetical protein